MNGNRVPEAALEDLRNLATVEAVLRLHGSELRPDGAGRWKARCPLPTHGEQTGKSPPFTLFKDGGWKCFGCEAGGSDGISLHAAVLGEDLSTGRGFRTVTSDLAERLGLSLKESGNGHGPASRAVRNGLGAKPGGAHAKGPGGDATEATPKPWPVPSLPEDTPEPVPSFGTCERIERIRDPAGELKAFQCRIRDKDGGKRYLWFRASQGLDGFSSNDLPFAGSDYLPRQPGELVLLTEGALAAAALRKACGALALGAVGSRPRREVLESLRGRDVLLWPDRDAVGWKKARSLAEDLQGIAASVRILSPEQVAVLPRKAGTEGKLTEEDGADAVEWLGGLKDSWGPAEIREALEGLRFAAQRVEPGGLPVENRQDLHDAETGPPGRYARFVRCAAEVKGDASEKVAPLVRFLAWPGRLSMLAGREKDSGKSTLASAAVAALSRGAPFAGLPTSQGRALWVAEESFFDVKFRLQAQGADLENVFLTTATELMEAAAEYGHANQAEALLHVVRQLQPAIWVIDTLGPFREGMVARASAADEWMPLFSILRRAAREDGVAGLILHHAKKADGGGYRDSSAIGAVMDRIIEPSKTDRATKRAIEFRSRGKGSLEAEDFRVVSFDVETQTPTLEAVVEPQDERSKGQASTGREGLRRKVREFIEANPRCSGRRIREAVTGKNRAISDVLQQLESAGVIAAENGSHGASLWSIAEPPH